MSLFEVKGRYIGDDIPQAAKMLLEQRIKKAGGTEVFVCADKSREVLGRCRTVNFSEILPEDLPALLDGIRHLPAKIRSVKYDKEETLCAGETRAKVSCPLTITFSQETEPKDIGSLTLAIINETRERASSVIAELNPVEKNGRGWLEVTVRGPSRETHQEAGTDCAVIRDQLFAALCACDIDLEGDVDDVVVELEDGEAPIIESDGWRQDYWD